MIIVRDATPSPGRPGYAGIVADIRHRVLAGDLRTGDRLPPVRDLARDCGVNVNTAARAYVELARAGVVVSRPGGGTRVAEGAGDRIRSDRAGRLADLVDGLFQRANALGFAGGEVEAAVAAWAANGASGDRAGGPAPRTVPGTISLAGSHDLSLEALARRLARSRRPVRLEARYNGSLEGLIALLRGEADLAGCHLLDEETGEYNVPFVRRLLPGQPVRLITLAHRRQGLIVPAGNPLNIAAIADLARPGLRLASRQRGSGTRTLLEFRLRRVGLDHAPITASAPVYPTHLAVAAAVAQGQADAGMGIEAAATAYGLGFVPLAEEPYELVVPPAAADRPEVRSLLATVRGAAFRREIGALAGYDVAETGRERRLG